MRKLQHTKKNTKLYKSKKNHFKSTNLRKHKKTHRFKKYSKKKRGGGNSSSFVGYASNPSNPDTWSGVKGLAQGQGNYLELSPTGGTIDPPIPSSSLLFSGGYRKSKKTKKTKKSKRGGGEINNPLSSVKSTFMGFFNKLSGSPHPIPNPNPTVQPIDTIYNNRDVLNSA